MPRPITPRARPVGARLSPILVAMFLMAARPAAGQVDLVLNMSDSPDPIPAGGVVTYAISVSNDGLTTATGVALAFDLPGGTTYEGFSGAGVSCSGVSIGQVGPATLSCALPDLAPLAVASVDIDLRTSTAGLFTVNARSTANEPDDQPGNNDAPEGTTVVAGADVAIAVVGPPTVASGDLVTYDITLSNGGPDPARDLEVQFPVPTGFILTGGLPGGCSLLGGTVTCSVPGPIASGSGLTVGSFTGQISAASGSTIAASGSVQVETGAPTSTARDPNAANNVDVANTTVTAGSDVRVTKSRSVGGPYFVGSGFSFVLSASYTGDAPTGLTLTDVLPSNYTIDTGAFALTQNGWTCSVAGQTVTCTRPSGGAAGANQSLGSVSIPVLINSAGTVTNTATINAASPTDPRPANNTDTDGGTTLQDPTADLAVSKQGPSPALVVTNQPFNFTLRASNGGPSPFFGTVILTDSLPADLTVNSYSLNGWTCLPAAPVVGPAEI
ncbi:MAG: hypothetical protein HKO98_04560, partial [Gemmatimonadetes bacterium]|nr:hypothetical protein [Gemmatimonadota bacterium]